VTLNQAPEVAGKAGEECLRSLGSPEGCDESLEVPRRHHVEVDLVVALHESKNVRKLRVDYVIEVLSRYCNS
jgi:hypothetical protein